MNLLRNTLCSLVLFFSLNTNAQEAKYLVNSGELIKEGISTHDKGKYKEAIFKYQQIPESDTNYIWSLYEIAISASADSQKAFAISTAKKGLEEFSNYEMSFMLQLGNLYDDINNYDSAAYYFDLCRKKYPNTHLPIHAKGINFYLRKKYDSAFVCFKEAVLMNPYAFNSHYFLGLLAMEKGYPVQAMLGFCTSLLISPDGGRSAACLKNIYDLANLSDTVLQRMDNRSECSFLNENYSDIESYFKAKIALDKKYPIKTKVEDNIFRQLNLICEKLPDTDDPNNFYQNYYGKIYSTLYKKDHFNGTCILIVSGIESDLVRKLVNDERKDKEKAAAFWNERFSQIGYHRSTALPVDYSKPGYFFSNSTLAAKGRFKNDRMEEKEGEWYYYYDNGQVTSIQNFENNKLEGNTKMYARNGTLTYDGNFKKDKLHGKLETYYNTGNPKFKGQYEDELLQGESKKYLSSGAISEVENRSKGKLSGPAFVYYESGFIHYEGKNNNDQLEGELKEYNASGRVMTTMNLEKGKPIGKRLSYYADGKLYEEGEMKNGEREGLFTTYYRSGKIRGKENYKNGKLHGNAIYYFENGVERINSNYENGDKEGLYTAKNEEGKLIEVAEFKRNHYKKITFYDVRTEKPVKVNVIDDKDRNLIKVYDAVGNLKSEIICNRDGVYNGDYKEFYYDGKVKEESKYKNGKLEGQFKSYHANGKVFRDVQYEEDLMQGVFKEHFLNGQIYMEGTMEKGIKEGYWYTYDSEGRLLEKEFYVNGDLHGKFVVYHPSGHLITKSYFTNGFRTRMIEYDTLGKVIQDVSFKPGEKQFLTKHYINGSKMEETYVHNNYSIGTERKYFPNGNLFSIAGRNNAMLDSSYVQYYLNGQKRIVGQYENGDKQGRWIYYDRFGNKDYIEYYDAGELNGRDTFFAANNVVEVITPKYNGKKHGWMEKYAPNGDLAYKYHFIDDILVGYTYQLPDGNFAPEIAVENSSKKEIVKTFYKNGKPSAELEYQNGEYNGKRTIYYPDGKVWLNTQYIMGASDGTEKEYYPNGQLQNEHTTKDGNIEGAYIRYHDNGKPLSEENYFNGYMHGTAKYYKKDGSLESTVLYYWGQIISIK